MTSNLKSALEERMTCGYEELNTISKYLKTINSYIFSPKKNKQPLGPIRILRK